MRSKLTVLATVVMIIATACSGAGTAAPSATVAASVARTTAPSVASGPGGPFMKEDSPEWKAILDAARKEGEVTVYGARSPEIVGAVGDFEKLYGIKLKYVEGSSGETQQRVLAEKDAGKFVASAILTGDSTVWNLGPGKEQLLAELKGMPNGANFHSSMQNVVKEANSTYWPAYAQVYGIYINTKLVSEGDAPKNWKDLLDPKWKGKIVQHDPTRNGGGQAMWGVMLNTPGYGEEFLKGLAKQDLLIVTGGGDPAAFTARGERAIGLPGNVFEITNQVGAPFKFIRPTDGLVTSQFVMGIGKNAPAPNAAKVFVNWVLSTQMQSLFVKNAYNMPAVTGVPGGEYQLNVEQLKFLGPGRITPTEADAVSAKSKTILAAK